MDKRTFLRNFSLLSIGTLPAIEAIAKWVDDHSTVPLDDLSKDEAFWAKIRSAYKLNSEYINLENGYYCMMPEETLNHYLDHVQHINFLASRYMRTVQFENRNIVRKRLAEIVGCSFDELIITRNTTESLDLVIGGLNWKKGDQAIMAEQDYGAMLNMFRLMNERYGVVNKKISLPNHPKSDEEIVKLYEDQITDKTRLIMVCQLVNISGQVLPIRKICDMAHQHGVEVMVDGAHAFAHLDFRMEDLGCDYYGTSLHKWMSAPLGAGFLYVKQDKIKNLWPLFAENEMPRDDIDRLNHMGTTPVHVDLGIANAIDFHNAIGIERKQERLKFLKRYWTEQLKDHPKIQFNTPWEEERHGAIANVLIEGWKSSDMSKVLMDKFQIWTVAINRPNVHGVRVTPNLYTSTEELDKFVEALKEMAS